MQCSWGKFQGTEHFVRDREIFKIKNSRDRESPLYFDPLKQSLPYSSNSWVSSCEYANFFHCLRVTPFPTSHIYLLKENLQNTKNTDSGFYFITRNFFSINFTFFSICFYYALNILTALYRMSSWNGTRTYKKTVNKILKLD